jgi:hypothetical protein
VAFDCGGGRSESLKPTAGLLRLAPSERSAVMTSKAEEYRELARECLTLAGLFPPGRQRDAALEMADQWGRLADEQDRATRLDEG